MELPWRMQHKAASQLRALGLLPGTSFAVSRITGRGAGAGPRRSIGGKVDPLFFLDELPRGAGRDRGLERQIQVAPLTTGLSPSSRQKGHPCQLVKLIIIPPRDLFPVEER
jgi:hypothetical protein